MIGNFSRGMFLNFSFNFKFSGLHIPNILASLERNRSPFHRISCYSILQIVWCLLCIWRDSSTVLENKNVLKLIPKELKVDMMRHVAIHSLIFVFIGFFYLFIKTIELSSFQQRLWGLRGSWDDDIHLK